MKTIRYIKLFGGRCGLTTDTKREVLRREGESNVLDVRPATQQEVDWVRAMGGRVPEGKVRREKPPQ